MNPPTPELPPCCQGDPSDPASWLYAAYNAGGDPNTAGLNYAGKPCPVWAELPENVRVKWRAVLAACAPHAAPGPILERRCAE